MASRPHQLLISLTEALTPLCAVLNSNSLVIGADNGSIYWYPTFDLMTVPAVASVVEMAVPSQKSVLGKEAISSLVVDGNYVELLAGSVNGKIFRAPIQVIEEAVVEDDLPDEEAQHVSKTKVIEAHSLGSDIKNGVVLCSKALGIVVQKTSGRSKCSLSLLVTGSHMGVLNFWRQTAQVVEPMTINGGIRRSAPRSIKSIFDLNIATVIAPTPGAFHNAAEASAPAPAICSLEFLPLVSRNSVICCVGLSNGTVELWGLNAHEHEESEEDRDEMQHVAGETNADKVVLVEDDEGSCIVRIEIKRLFQSHVFHSAVSLLTIISTSSSTGLAIGSHSDRHVYLLNVVKQDVVELSNITSYIAVDEGEFPRAATWNEGTLCVFCASGSIYTFETNQAMTAPLLKRQFESGIEGITGALVSSSNTDQVIILSNSNSIYTFPMRSLNADSEAMNSDYKSFDQSDIALCASFAPSGKYFATGSLDGSVHVWKIVSSESYGIVLANKMILHKGAVVSMAFSVDSSLLITCGVDGSTFVVTLDKPSTLKGAGMPTMSTKSNLFQESEAPSLLAAVSSHKDPAHSNMTWLEIREQDRLRELKSQQKFKSMGIVAAVGEIAHRLNVLITQNGERTELEKLPRSAFVIDIKRMEELCTSRVVKAKEMADLYKQRNIYNEAIAARVKAICWDRMEVNAGCLVPFSSVVGEGGTPFSPKATTAAPADSSATTTKSSIDAVYSFSIPKLTATNEVTYGKVKRMRAIEMRAQRASSLGVVQRIAGKNCYRTGWQTTLKGCPQTISWIFNDGTKWPTYENIDNLLTADKVVVAEPKDAAKDAGKDGKDKAVAVVSAFEEEEDQQQADEEREIDENNVLNLLYPAESVRTQIQKRTQIVLLQEVVRNLKVKFNEKWRTAYRDKEDILASIESRNVRIRAIQDDLHLYGIVLYSPTLMNSELPSSNVQVADEEIGLQRYESEAARAARQREEEEAIRRESEKDSEDVKGRALVEMMHGTLEVKRDVLSEVSNMVRPEWMDTLAVTEMNETQLKEFDAYNQKLKTLQEEQNAYRKSLEQEMKKLKSEITDVCKAFDDRLDDLARLKVLVNREILSHEVYIARISLNMAKVDQGRITMKKMEDQLQTLRKEQRSLGVKVEKYTERAEEMKRKIAAVDEEAKGMDKSFKRDLQNLCNTSFDNAQMKVFMGLFRQRTYPRGYYDNSAAEGFGDQSDADVSASQSASRAKQGKSNSKGGKHSRSQKKSSGLGGSNANATKDNRSKMKASRGVNQSGGGNRGGEQSLGPMQQAAAALRSSEETDKAKDKEKDPYYEAFLQEEKRKKILESQIPLLTPLNMETDCPEGFDVDQFYWSKLQELRNARLEKEIEGKQLSIEYVEFKQKLDFAENEEQSVTRSINDLKQMREASLNNMHSLDSDLELAVCMRQGQDEVDRDAVVTDYSEALLMPSDVVAKYNFRIKELGKEKINILTKMKQFRRKINLIGWEAAHRSLEARHYESYLTDLQLFRVTRELQKVIRDGNDKTDLNKDKVDKVNLRKDFLLKDIELKLTQLQKGKELLNRQLEERNQECLSLVDKISNMKVSVTSSKSVKQSRDDSRGGTADSANLAATQKMKKVVGRRRLVDTARAQAEEIDFLRQELDKMRQRTFPSFIRATKKRLNPDAH
eukprot:gene23933-30217_t